MSVVIIPARMGSTRLPGKMLCEIDGLPLVVHVMRRAAKAKRVQRVIVASADPEILSAVVSHGGEVWQTASDHSTGTDRVAEAAAALGPEVTHIINVQGDNLSLDPAVIDAVARELEESLAQVVTPVTPFPEDADVTDPSKVKAVVGQGGRALYFSRSPVPVSGPWWLHIGVYGFTRAALREFAGLAPTSLEKSEGLEQLRLLAHGIEIHTVRVASGAGSIDTPRDLAEARSKHTSSSHMRL